MFFSARLAQRYAGKSGFGFGGNNRPFIPIGKSAVFALSLSGFSVVAASQITNWQTDHLEKQSSNWLGITSGRLKTIKEMNLASKLQAGLDKIHSMPETVQRVYILASENLLAMTDGQRSVAAIIALNTVVFAGWQIPHPAVQRYMARHFLHSYNSPLHTMLTSVFSHRSIAHLGFNMLALYSFGPLSFKFLERQQHADTVEGTAVFKWLSLYLSAGCMSNLASISATKYLQRSLMPSLGASGAVYSTLVMSAYSNPDIKVNLIFLPFFGFPISTGVMAMVGFDVAGLLAGWKLLDHAAHLGGAAFGAFGCYYFNDIFNRTRNIVKLDIQTA
ncbi:hypothetical protein E3P77_03117 [Wallemia ichthyophaga]|uniref:Peptidase S54 rhomboid domain-containing protein n=2 Tax=Wallemia ichthyophaga TaxID=245174 RepID=A0A4T0HXY2_WALIC|nr:uncharacterized protein J056_004322 [Wallemia ichthyophaga EXF-994]TIA79886.1 hypothetical protein E3P98_03040 [Wallemia ichthyophaga]EOR01536.1 hypothetical protein J056_004322 [Wallemia ichthyophaga EXF-994]TIB08751.1 hypothetical protein E3P90_03559 [Wallemia ichthyophaga]TIB10223.1 hypothetical protein E3P93_02972 [Wallemia ichthyophaga]TIB20901.1 hypothetical protein E3P89_02947 [Wallemia ichthyophaga]